MLLAIAAFFALLWLPVLVHRALFKKDVAGQVVLITGAASGIGRLTALKFAKLRSRLVLWDVNTEGLESVKREALALGAHCEAFTCDITNEETVKRIAAEVRERCGDVDILINNAGVVVGRKFGELQPRNVNFTFNVNTLSHFWIVREFLPAMRERKRGHIVTIASMAGIVGETRLVDYCASKAAAIGFHQSLRVELRREGFNNIHMTCVCPFFINTGMFDGAHSPLSFLLPILEPDYVAETIVKAIRQNREKIMMPWSCNLVPVLMQILPTYVQDFVGKYLGSGHYMDRFQGRAAAAAAAAPANKSD